MACFLTRLASFGGLLGIVVSTGPGCCSGYEDDAAQSRVGVRRGEVQPLTLTLTRLRDIPGEFRMDVSVLDAPAGSEIRIELEPGMELVGTGSTPTLRLEDLDRRLARCGGSCVFPVVASIADDGEAGTVMVGAHAFGGRCGEPVLSGMLELP